MNGRSDAPGGNTMSLLSHSRARGTLTLRFAFMVMILAAGAAAVYAGGSQEKKAASGSGATVNVVAAENFYGDVAEQIGGQNVTVTSIMSDPNVDPHEYESSVNDAKAVADASLVIESGGGYDDWMDKLISASPNSSRVVITGFDIAPTKLPENEHVFYGIGNMGVIAAAIRDALSKLAPSHSDDFAKNYAAFSQSLSAVTDKMNEIKSKYPNAPVGLTETIFLYQAVPMGLNVLTPFEFQKSIAEGNDPPADVALQAEQQITGKQIRALIYNEQTVTDITTKLENDAKAAGIPIVPVTETMPPQAQHYQFWMLDQLNHLEQALASSPVK
jgi:zinc/manganese transport system substrate-binding protein